MSRHYAYALCRTDEEFAIIKRAAAAEGLSVSNFVRRAVNAYLLEQAEDSGLLSEVNTQLPGRPPAGRSV